MKTDLLCFANQRTLYGLKTTGVYDMPVIAPVYEIPNRQHYSWIGFNECMSCKQPSTKMVHFYIHDYQFERVWNNINKYTEILKRFPVVCTPDFSMFTDTPKAVNIMQSYKRQALGAYWQRNGITVIPTVGWVKEDSFRWCFDGVPKRSIVSISTLGVLNNKWADHYFKQGYEEMKRVLEPKEILCYGRLPEWLKGEVTEMGCRVKMFDGFNQVKGIPDEQLYAEMGI